MSGKNTTTRNGIAAAVLTLAGLLAVDVPVKNAVATSVTTGSGYIDPGVGELVAFGSEQFFGAEILPAIPELMPYLTDFLAAHGLLGHVVLFAATFSITYLIAEPLRPSRSKPQ